MVGFSQQHDDRRDVAAGFFEDADRAGGDQRGVIVEHRPGRLADPLDIDRIGIAHDRFHRRAIGRRSARRIMAGRSRIRQFDNVGHVPARLDPGRQLRGELAGSRSGRSRWVSTACGGWMRAIQAERLGEMAVRRMRFVAQAIDDPQFDPGERRTNAPVASSSVTSVE